MKGTKLLACGVMAAVIALTGSTTAAAEPAPAPPKSPVDIALDAAIAAAQSGVQRAQTDVAAYPIPVPFGTNMLAPQQQFFYDTFANSCTGYYNNRNPLRNSSQGRAWGVSGPAADPTLPYFIEPGSVHFMFFGIDTPIDMGKQTDTLWVTWFNLANGQRGDAPLRSERTWVAQQLAGLPTGPETLSVTVPTGPGLVAAVIHGSTQTIFGTQCDYLPVAGVVNAP
ncbi:hypothetical protein GCM10007304_12640 [Rhodococcoides trifolii]|uniref:Secreted protein n=1 Tax=Rhodococcoides trifolii TaxID=908250 RepID=A0A917CXC9_9NOCA|nr:hypothetical protein [Rhodococcus trifolii]GGG00193.1 hypothetical protein GCM10007304_12640 [Rhodococcus trifolii]